MLPSSPRISEELLICCYLKDVRFQMDHFSNSTEYLSNYGGGTGKKQAGRVLLAGKRFIQWLACNWFGFR